ncbi:MAG TPA: serine hydrolase [Candidatus Saccharimonadales bacterium]|nr:serine hydrolase [Candidatus Saccharimonadales bacterium]
MRRWIERNQLLAKRLAYAVLACMVLSVIFQLLYPSNKVLPGVEVANQSVGGLVVNEASKRLERAYKDAGITVKTEDKDFGRTLVQMGANINTDTTAKSAAHYAVWQRVIPFSSLVIMAERNTTPIIDFDDEHLTNFAKEISKEGYVAPVNASVSVKKGKADLVPAKPSKEYPVKDVEAALHAAEFTPRTTVSLKAKVKEAPRSDDEVQDVLKDAQQAVDMDLVLTLDKEAIKVGKETVGSWLDFPENSKTKRLELGLKPDVVKKYLEGIQPKVYKAPGTTKVTLMDGKEVGRTTGQSGRGIDIERTTAALQDAIKKGEKTTLTVTLAVIPAQVVYDRKYSSAGLSALLASLTSSKGNYAISVMELGTGRSASSNGAKQYVAASTYKLFVAYAVIKEVEAGRMSWSEAINGQTVSSCFDKMIVISDNACPKAFAARIGWQTIEDEVHAIGMSQSTQLTPSPYTTSSDLALFLYKLQNGSIIAGENRDRLLDAMKRQSYTRSGIPAGTGVVTADKVGDVDGYKHDAAIVYGPKGPYVIVVMTSGGSWSGIADVARQVHSFLNS